MLDQLTEEWVQIQNADERRCFYNEKVFPEVLRIVVPREQSRLERKYTHLIIPVGLTPEPIILTIRILAPERVCFLYTKASRDFLDQIAQQAGLKLSQVRSEEIQETNVPGIYHTVRKVFTDWGCPDSLAVDITPGKKSMGGGCALAGVLIGADIFYMDFQYDKSRHLEHPIPGTETLVILDNPYDVFGDIEFERAKQLYTGFDYAGAARLLQDLEKKTSNAERFSALASLCTAYAAWDNWELERASDSLEDTIRIVEKLQRSDPSTPLSNQLLRLKRQAGVLERLQQGLTRDLKDSRQQLDFLRTPALYQPLIGSLRAGALRAEQRKKFDVAALLHYRLLELLSQRRLSSHGLVTAAPDYSSLPDISIDELRNRFVKILRDQKMKEHPEALPQENGIALLDGYALLMAFGDPFVDGLHLGKLRASITTRNAGIYAHGFKPLDEKEYRRFKELAEELMNTFTNLEPEYRQDWDDCIFIEAI